MSRNIFSFYLSILTIVLLYSCSSSPSVSPPYKAWVLYLDKDKSSLGVPYYALGVKDLVDLNSLSSLEGKYFNIKEGGSMEVESQKGSVVSSSSFEKGSDPYIRYKVKDSVIISKDYNSLMLLSIYYQFTQIFGNLKEYTGINPEDVVKNIENNKMSIWYEPIITAKGSKEDSGTSSVQKLNAAYFPKFKQFILCQRSDLERVPISSSLSVLSHEFGHALFEYIFYQNNFDEEKDKRYENSDAISGMNEGFADYISYTYTGVSNILGASFLFEKDYIQRDFVASTFTFDNMLLETKTSDNVKNYKSYCTGGYYCYGTLLARSFYEATNSSGYADKKYEFLHKIIQALSSAKNTFDENSKDLYDSNTGEFKPSSDRKIISVFLYSLLKNFDSSLRDNLCSSFMKNFESVMNKGYHKEVCPNLNFSLIKPLKYGDDGYVDLNILEYDDSFIYLRR